MVQNKSKNAYSYRLSLEELMFFLNLLKFNTLPGLGSDPFSFLSPEKKEQMLAAGFNSLRAKGWLTVSHDSEQTVGVEHLFVSPLIVCATSRKALSIERQSKDGDLNKVLAFQSPELFVLYRLVEPWIYEFIVTTSQEDLISFFTDFIGKPIGKLTSKDKKKFQLSLVDSEKLIELQLKRDVAAILQLLHSKNIHKQISEKYAASLSKVQYNTILKLMEFPEKILTKDDIQGRNFNIFASTDTTWVIETLNENMVDFKEVNNDYFQDIFSNWTNYKEQV